jgi:hypothetical protein
MAAKLARGGEAKNGSGSDVTPVASPGNYRSTSVMQPTELRITTKIFSVHQRVSHARAKISAQGYCRSFPNSESVLAYPSKLSLRFVQSSLPSTQYFSKFPSFPLKLTQKKKKKDKKSTKKSLFYILFIY